LKVKTKALYIFSDIGFRKAGTDYTVPTFSQIFTLIGVTLFVQASCAIGDRQRDRQTEHRHHLKPSSHFIGWGLKTLDGLVQTTPIEYITQQN